MSADSTDTGPGNHTDQANLARLGAELATRGYEAAIRTPPDRLPHSPSPECSARLTGSNAVTSQDSEPTLAGAQAAHPAWRCWRAISGLYHARPADARPADDRPLLTGEDPLDHRDEIRRAETPW